MLLWQFTFHIQINKNAFQLFCLKVTNKDNYDVVMTIHIQINKHAFQVFCLKVTNKDNYYVTKDFYFKVLNFIFVKDAAQLF